MILPHGTGTRSETWLRSAGRNAQIEASEPMPARFTHDATRFTFDGLTPPRKAAKALADLLTMSAVRVVLDQMSGTRHRSPMAPKLIDYLHAKPLRADASAWLAELMAHEELDYRLVAVRIIETRKVLACDAEGFDYDWMKAEAIDGTREDNLTLRRAMLTGALEAGDRDSSGDRDS